MAHIVSLVKHTHGLGLGVEADVVTCERIRTTWLREPQARGLVPPLAGPGVASYQ